MFKFRLCAILPLLILLPGCGSNPLAKEYVTLTPNIPSVPSDVERCAEEPVVRGTRLSPSEVNRLWNRDRASLARVNGCFYRLICQYHDVRREIGKIEDEPQCTPTEEELRRETSRPKQAPGKKSRSP